MIEYLENISGVNRNNNDSNLISEIESKGMSIQKPATNNFKFESKLFN